jgi:hypothetical protein
MIRIVKTKINNSDVLNRLNMRRAILIVRIQANDRDNDRSMDNGQMKRAGKRFVFSLGRILYSSINTCRKKTVHYAVMYLQAG